jgi:hypothetical protein
MAYRLTYLSGERVKVGSTDVARISEYQRLAGEAGAAAPLITDQPCARGEPVVAWYLCPRGADP